MSTNVDEIVDRYRGKPGLVISVLEAIQEECGYLPKDTLIRVSQLLEVPLSRLFTLATFYSAFTLKPRGKHTVYVCLGTACHVRGAPKIMKEMSRELGIGPHDTTADNQFTLETVRCVGGCSLAPVVVVNKDIYGHNTADKVPGILDKYKEKS